MPQPLWEQSPSCVSEPMQFKSSSQICPVPWPYMLLSERPLRLQYNESVSVDRKRAKGRLAKGYEGDGVGEGVSPPHLRWGLGRALWRKLCPLPGKRFGLFKQKSLILCMWKLLVARNQDWGLNRPSEAEDVKRTGVENLEEDSTLQIPSTRTLQ